MEHLISNTHDDKKSWFDSEMFVTIFKTIFSFDYPIITDTINQNVHLAWRYLNRERESWTLDSFELMHNIFLS